MHIRREADRISIAIWQPGPLMVLYTAVYPPSAVRTSTWIVHGAIVYSDTQGNGVDWLVHAMGMPAVMCSDSRSAMLRPKRAPSASSPR